MKTFDLKILTAEKTFYDGPCESLIVPISDGHYGILADHQNTIAAIVPGILEFIAPGEEKVFAAVSNGMLLMEDNKVLILAITAERPEEIDENRARRAMEEEKEEMLRQQSVREFKASRLRIEREMSRLRLKRKGTYQDID